VFKTRLPSAIDSMGSLLKAHLRRRAQKHCIFIMGQKIRRKDWTWKSVESKLLSSFLFLGRLLIYFFKGQVPLQREKERINHFQLHENCFFGEGVVTFMSTGYNFKTSLK
jgi:hypothetical protein